MAFTPTEIYMWLPDVVAVVVRDAPPIKGAIIAHEEDESATLYGTWYDRTDPRDDETRAALIIGPEKSYYRFEDQLSVTFLDRPDARDEGNWTFTGFGGTITKVVILSEPYDEALAQSAGVDLQCVMEHTCLLHLSTDLTEGSYTISNATADIPATGFVFDDEVTRAGGLKVNQIGYRPSDIYKICILAQRLSQGPNAGAVDFDDYGFVGTDKFHVLNANKDVVFTGDIVQRIAPDEAETGYTSIYVADYGSPLTVTSISAHGTTPTCTTSGAHGLATNDRVMFRGMPLGYWFLGEENGSPAQTITVTGANTFTFSNNTAGSGVYAAGRWSTADGGYDSLVYPCALMNRAGTYTYDLDFSAYAPADATTNYYIQIPGYGISDPFILHEAASAIGFAKCHEGYFSQRRGIAVSSGEYTRGANFRDDGVTHFRNYRSNQTSATSYEGGTTLSFNSHLGSFKPCITTDRITLVDSGWGLQDAGDIDTHLHQHMPIFYHLASMLLDVPQASRITEFEVPLSSEAIGSRYDGTDDWPPLMHELAWFMDFWLSLQQEDGSVLSGLSTGFGQTPMYGEPSHLYHGHMTENFADTEPTGSGNLIHGAILSADHPSNYHAAGGFALFSLLCTDYGDTTLAATYKQAAIDAWDWAESIRDSHLDDGVARDAYYDTYLNFKKLAKYSNLAGQTHPNLITAVDTGADTVTVLQGALLASGDKCCVEPGSGALPGGLSTNTDYYVNVSGSTYSFHNSNADGISGANKINLTAGYSSGCAVFGTITDAEYATCMAGLHTACGSTTVGCRVDAAGALIRCFGYDDVVESPALKALFAAGSPAPSEWATFHYMRAALAAGVLPTEDDVVDYAFGDHDLDNRPEPGTQYDGLAVYVDYNQSPNVSSYPYAGTTDVNSAFRPYAAAGPQQWRLLIDAVEEGHTTQKNKLLKNFQSHAAFMLGANGTGKCTLSGAGARNEVNMLHEDAFNQGLKWPDGIIFYTWHLWPQAGTVFFSGPKVGSSNWTGWNVATGEPDSTDRAYKVVEPWKNSEPYWTSQINNRSMVTQSEYSIGDMWGGAMTLLANHLYDSNTIYTMGEAEITYNSAGLRFRWHT